MSFNFHIFLKLLSPKLTTKALQTLDRATTIVVAVCWGGAIMMTIFAIYTTSLSVTAKRAAEAALATEPRLPRIVHKSIDGRAEQILVERLQHRYPEINFSQQPNQTLNVTAIDGSRFRQWLTALSYIDTISPQYHWSLQHFCVGKCIGSELMHATLVGEAISFEMPQP